jgi:hypothetical protein
MELDRLNWAIIDMGVMLDSPPRGPAKVLPMSETEGRETVKSPVSPGPPVPPVPPVPPEQPA